MKNWRLCSKSNWEWVVTYYSMKQLVFWYKEYKEYKVQRVEIPLQEEKYLKFKNH